MPSARLPSKPRYLELADRLEQDIAKGHYSVVEFLPTEAELCKVFSASRHTIREALRSLYDRGLVTRRQGSGTLVIATHPSVTYRQTLTALEDLLQYASETELDIFESTDVSASTELASILECAPGRPWRRISAVRRSRSEGSPICETTIYIDMPYAEVERELRRRYQAIYRLIEARYGEQVLEVRQTISAVTLSQEVANRLDATPGAPALRFVRRYIGRSGRSFLISISMHPADRFNYSMRIRRGHDRPDDVL
ncbi:MAG TPA: GntR family transcriptional regulator [Woeseiaceae bacterium]|nr:GntR family transcriptional regulator [Woeseiaceae bacterium]